MMHVIEYETPEVVPCTSRQCELLTSALSQLKELERLHAEATQRASLIVSTLIAGHIDGDADLVSVDENAITVKRRKVPESAATTTTSAVSDAGS